MEPKTARRPIDRQFDTRSVPDLDPNTVECSATNTILTLAGEKPAGALVTGDKVITRDTGIALVTHVARRKVVQDAVLIKAGSLGHNRPPEDALLPANAHLLLRDWRAQALYGSVQAIAEARRLCDGEFISLMPDHELDLVSISFAKPHIIYAAGLELACGAGLDF